MSTINEESADMRLTSKVFQDFALTKLFIICGGFNKEKLFTNS